MKALMNWSGKHPVISICIIVFISGCLFSGITKLKMDASASGMMIKGDPKIAFYNESVKKFGSDTVTVLFVKDKNLFSPAKLEKLDDLNYQLEELANVEKVESIFSVTDFKGEDGMLSTNPLVDYPPETIEEANRIKAAALKNPLLLNNIISKDGTITAINIFVTPDKNDPDFDIKFTKKIEDIIGESAPHFDQIFQTGNSYLKQSVTNSILRNQIQMVPFSILVLLSILVICMRTPSGAIIPILTAGTSVFWTFCFMGYFGIPINMLTGIVPSLIIVIGSTEDIHLLSEYFEGLHEHGGVKKTAIDYMVSKTGTAVMLTAMTTFLGFLTITINEITILKQFGMAASFGLLVNPVITCMLVPVYLRFFGPIRKNKEHANGQFTAFIAKRIIGVINYNKWLVFSVLIFISVIIGSFAVNVKVDNDMLGFFKESSEVKSRSEILHNELAGSQVIYIRIDGGEKDIFKKPEYLGKIAAIQDYIESRNAFDKSISIADHIKLIHREMNDGDDAFHQIPRSANLIPQYLLTLRRDEISRYVSSDFSEANIMVRHNIGSSYELKQAIKSLDDVIKTHFSPRFKINFTGENILINFSSDSIASGQVKAISLLFLIIFIIMSVLFVNIKAGFISLVSNAFPIILLFGVMGLFKIPLNVGSSMVAAIAIGIAVDDTIHFMTRYNKEMRILQDQNKAMEVCIRAEITPIMTTSVALAMGFAVVCFSDFVPLINFGFLSALVMVFALIGDLFLTPILLSSTQLITIWDMISLTLDKVINESRFFTSLKSRQIKKVILLGKILEKKKDDHAIKYGDDGSSMFLLLEGEADVLIRDSLHDNSKVVATIRPGDIFGEIAMVNPGPRTADIKATADIKYLEIDWKGMNRIRMIYPRIAAHLYCNLSKILGSRLKETTINLWQTSNENEK